PARRAAPAPPRSSSSASLRALRRRPGATTSLVWWLVLRQAGAKSQGCLVNAGLDRALRGAEYLRRLPVLQALRLDQDPCLAQRLGQHGDRLLEGDALQLGGDPVLGRRGRMELLLPRSFFLAHVPDAHRDGVEPGARRRAVLECSDAAAGAHENLLCQVL